MNIKETKAFETAHRFWDWWTDELRGLLPENMRGEPTERDRFDVFMSKGETTIEFVHQGEGESMLEACEIDELPVDSWEQISEIADKHKPRLFLENVDILNIPVRLPRASSSQIDAALQLQLPTLVPLELHMLDWGYVELERNDKTIELALIIAKSARLDELDNLFAEQGLMPPAFCANIEGKVAYLRKPLEISSRSIEKSKFAMAALVMIAMIPLITIAGANLMTATEVANIERLEGILASRQAQEKQILKEEMVRRSVAPLLNMPSASNRLEALAQNLPDTSWTVSTAQKPDGRFEFVADMQDRDDTEQALNQTKDLQNPKPVEKLEADGGRFRVRYQVGR